MKHKNLAVLLFAFFSLLPPAFASGYPLEFYRAKSERWKLTPPLSVIGVTVGTNWHLTLEHRGKTKVFPFHAESTETDTHLQIMQLYEKKRSIEISVIYDPMKIYDGRVTYIALIPTKKDQQPTRDDPPAEVLGAFPTSVTTKDTDTLFASDKLFFHDQDMVNGFFAGIAAVIGLLWFLLVSVRQRSN